jgi:hypothetical protein
MVKLLTWVGARGLVVAWRACTRAHGWDVLAPPLAPALAPGRRGLLKPQELLAPPASGVLGAAAARLVGSEVSRRRGASRAARAVVLDASPRPPPAAR